MPSVLRQLLKAHEKNPKGKDKLGLRAFDDLWVLERDCGAGKTQETDTHRGI